MCLNYVVEVFKYFPHLLFLLHQEYPSHSSVVINKGHKPSRTCNAADSGGPPNITLEQREGMRWFIWFNGIGGVSMFGQLTYFALEIFGIFVEQ